MSSGLFFHLKVIAVQTFWSRSRILTGVWLSKSSTAIFPFRISKDERRLTWPRAFQ
jgi:hypothetical protein